MSDWITISGYKTKYKVLKKGSGSKTVGVGNKVVVHATGTVTATGKKFWSTKDKNEPFEYKALSGGVIAGWDQGCKGMKVGEVRQIDIPAEEGYGKAGFPAWGIPKGGGIGYEIECLKIK